MKRSSLAALAALAALPAAVIASTAMNTAASTSAPAARTPAAIHARLADAGGSGNSGTPTTPYVQMGGCLDDDLVQATVAATNPNPGQYATITVTGSDGSIRTVRSNAANFGNTFFDLQPSTTYTVTLDGGPATTKTTPSC